MKSILKKATEQQRDLTEPEARDFLKKYDINLGAHALISSGREALTDVEKVGFPVAMKIVSPDILHKTDAGGVKLGVETPEKAQKAYEEIVKNARAYNPEARIDGVMVTPMAQPGLEVIIGAVRDQQFGPVVMFGLGGIMVEVFKDVSFRLVPLSRKDVEEMLEEIWSAPLLKGYRGEKPRDKEALIAIIMQVSKVMENNPEIQEIDLNPVFAYEKGALAVDARIIL